ncbi:MAG: hypothetical protein ABII23_07475 [bacterium]
MNNIKNLLNIITRIIDEYYVVFLIKMLIICILPGLSSAENYLIPPSSKDVSSEYINKNISQADSLRNIAIDYLKNEINREDISEEILAEAETYCQEQIEQGIAVELYRSQLLKISLDRLFLNNFKNPEWIKKQIKRDISELKASTDPNRKKILKKRITTYQWQLVKLKGLNSQFVGYP